jgi:hypothetical protein
MKKVLLSIVAVVAISAASFGQGRFSIGPEIALPMGDWSDAIGLGIGGSLRYEGTINDNLNWLVTAGYLSFAEKDNSGLKFSAIPVQAGLKYYFTESFNGFYGGVDLGIHALKAKADIDGFGSISASETKFGIAPSIGYHLASVDISAKYQIISDANYLGFRVAYVFGGK